MSALGTLGTIPDLILEVFWAPKSIPNRCQIEPKPFEIEFGMLLWLCAHSRRAPGVSWGGLGVSRTSFGDGFGVPNPSKINEISTSKVNVFSEAFC